MRTSPQAEEFKKCLPEDLQKVIKEISFSYQLSWQIISGHLQEIYGKYGNPDFCLSAYYGSEAYRKNRHKIRRCPDLPLIGMDGIQQMLSDEAEYKKMVQELLAVSSEEESPETIHRMASLLGIYPDKRPDALYRHLVAKELIPEEEWPQIVVRAGQNENLLMVVSVMLAKTFLPGYLLDFPAAGSVMTQPRNRYYYRGENAYFRSSKASCFRSSSSSESSFIQKVIDRLRLYQCWETLDQFEAVQHWGFCQINYLALAQHYGFRTQMLDITSDLKTALFFACCKFGPDRKWHPLDNSDFAHRNSRPHIASMGGDSRYGVIYRSPSEITDLRWCIEPEDTAFEMIIPVGYQPFMRCSHQHGYMLLTNEDYDLLQDSRFDKFKFRLTEDICNWIYAEMNQGDLVYPNDDVPDISLEIEALNKQNEISRKIFDAVTEDFNLSNDDIQHTISVLKHCGISIVDAVTPIKPEKLLQINQSYTAQYAMEKVGITPQLSPIFSV